MHVHMHAFSMFMHVNVHLTVYIWRSLVERVKRVRQVLCNSSSSSSSSNSRGGQQQLEQKQQQKQQQQGGQRCPS